jgi:hypothetical protein
MAMTKRWTIEERMTLHHLLARREYESKNDDWWNLYKLLHDPTRGRTVIYEDWRHGGNSSRSQMWEAQIRKTKLEYTDEQRAAFKESRANLHAAARRLGIELPSKRAAHNAQTATPEQLLSARARRNTLPTRSLTKSPNAKPTSGIATASGSSRSNAQQLQGDNAKAAPKNLQVAVVKASSKLSTLIATQKYKPQNQSARIIKCKKTLISKRPSSVHKVTPKAILVRQLNIHYKTTAFNDIHPSAPLLTSNKTISRASKLLRVQGDKAASSSKESKASIILPTPRPSPPAQSRADKIQKELFRAGRCRKTVASHSDSDDDSDVSENITVSPRQTAQAQTNQGDTDSDCYIVETPKFGSLRWRREEQRRLSRQPKKIRKGK